MNPVADIPIAAVELPPHARLVEEVVRDLGTDLERGLRDDEAASRLLVYGPNSLPEPPGRSLLRALLDQFANFLIVLLIIATAIAALIGEYVDAITIAAIVALTAILGLVQEWRAERALQALRGMMAPTARLLREGRVIELPAPEVVPGDVVILEVGHYVPADIRLVESATLNINEASLTGESDPVSKDAASVLAPEATVADRRNSAFAGTVVTYGRGCGVVVATGASTEVGGIATIIGTVEEGPTPLQRRMSNLGRWLGGAAIAISVVIFGMGAATGEDVLDMLLTSVSLAVAAVPEGLPAVVVISLALGMQRMARRHALMRRLAATETLGSATVIASDKTGTLTRGEMTVVRIYLGPDLEQMTVTGTGYEPVGEFRGIRDVVAPRSDRHIRLLLTAGALCNDARLLHEKGRWRVVGDTTEGALVVAARKAGLDWEQLEAEEPRISEVPFSSDRARMTTVHQVETRCVAYMKGAPEVILPLCESRRRRDDRVPLTEEDRGSVASANEELAALGLRILAVAYREFDSPPPSGEAERRMCFLGLVAMHDPPRDEAIDSIDSCREAGILPIMITGDHARTALAVARDLRMADDAGVLTGSEVEHLTDSGLREAVQRVRVYARVTSGQKLRIVEALKANGHVVAVTGDGVNDAPALKRADIGVAMGITGTDVAKEAADMVITDDNFASIVAAVEEGRKIFDNIRNFVVFLLSANVGEVLLIFVAVMVGLPLPLLAAQILLVNLATDSFPALALSLEPGEPDAMRRPPKPPSEPVLTRSVAAATAIRGLAEAAGALVVFVLWREVFDSTLELARSATLATIVMAELLEAHGSRSLYRTAWSIGVFSNLWLIAATLVSFVVLIAVLYVPPLQDAFHSTSLGWGEWLAVAVASLGRLAVIEGMKIIRWPLRR